MVGPGFEEEFEDEDTNPSLDTTPATDEPSVELIWVEEPGRGMVLKVYPVKPRDDRR